MHPAMHVEYSLIDSPVGPLLLGATERGLAVLAFHHGRFPGGAFARAEWTASETAVAPYVRELREYFEGKRKQFDFELDLHGTEFQVRCWRALLDIPYGETATYQQLATAVGSPKACRAVGSANGDNPVAIVVPCHRVIASNSTLGGYGGGLSVKEYLLRLEGAWPLKHQTDLLFR